MRIRDKQFRLPKVTLLDYKTVEMDRVLTAFFARVYHGGQDSRLTQSGLNTVDKFVAAMLALPDRFRGFDEHPEIVRAWLETHLLDLVNRGKANQQVAAPRPLHGYTYRFRNPKHCRDYGAAQQLYEMLSHARNGVGQQALDRLRGFFFAGVDLATERIDESVVVDVETQALLSSLRPETMRQDAPLRDSREAWPPLCVGAADIMADDVLRLLAYRRVVPRSVLVEYLKILFAFHLALYHLRLLRFLPLLLRRPGEPFPCKGGACPVRPTEPGACQAACPCRIGLFLDVANQPDTRARRLAEYSADAHYRRIPGYIRAQFLAKKLDEMAAHLLQLGKIPAPSGRVLSFWDVLALLDDRWTQERELFFGSRLMTLTGEAQDADGALDPEIEAVVRLGLSDTDKYVEALAAARGVFQRGFIVKSLDALSLKNRPGALLAQDRGAGAARRFVLDSRLLEVLLQMAVLRYEPDRGHVSGPIRVEDLLGFLRERYGLYIDRLPPGDGFGATVSEDLEALRANREALRRRLREIGFFQDLSDAYITQQVTPRYRIEPPYPAAPPPAGGGAP